jgi:hypothetical protein
VIASRVSHQGKLDEGFEFEPAAMSPSAFALSRVSKRRARR